MTKFDALPLFPLNAVLYPEMPMPLHIFEPRYLDMIRRCQAENGRFGIVLIQAGNEFGETPVPYSVGTTARVGRTEELLSGRLNIVAVGESRFRILDTHHKNGCLTARAEPLSEEQGTDPSRLRETHGMVSELFRTYLRTLLALANRRMSSVQIPSDSLELSYAVANILEISLVEKQRLLECGTVAERLAIELDILKAEVETQEFLCELHDRQSEGRNAQISPLNVDKLLKMTSMN